MLTIDTLNPDLMCDLRSKHKAIFIVWFTLKKDYYVAGTLLRFLARQCKFVTFGFVKVNDTLWLEFVNAT